MDGEARRKDRGGGRGAGGEGRGSPNRQPVPRPNGMLIGAGRLVLSLEGPGFSMTDIVSGASNHVVQRSPLSRVLPFGRPARITINDRPIRVRINRGGKLVEES